MATVTSIIRRATRSTRKSAQSQSRDPDSAGIAPGGVRGRSADAASRTEPDHQSGEETEPLAAAALAQAGAHRGGA